MSDTQERAKALHPIAVGYAEDIGSKLAADITQDGFTDMAEGLSLMCMTFTEGTKQLSLRIAPMSVEVAAELLEHSATELLRCAKVLRRAQS